MWLFESYFGVFSHIRARESEGTACVVAVSGTRFESLFYFIFYFLGVCTYGHARTATHVQARESEGTACVVVVSGMWFESFFFSSSMYGHAHTATHVRACTSLSIIPAISVCLPFQGLKLIGQVVPKLWPS